MIDAILRGLLIAGGTIAGARLGRKYLTPSGETPMWTGHLGGDMGKPAVSVTRAHYQDKSWYRVYVATDGQWAAVAACWQWGEVLASLQQWEQYISERGTVQSWMAHHAKRTQEIRDMEEAWNMEPPPEEPRHPRWRTGFICHPDGTVEEEKK
jgi:hypothetical protein